MKYTAAVAALIANVRADAPPAFNEPPFAVSTHPAAAGLVQIESACAQSGVAGVMCAPASNMLFATGMNGDEDLGEDITMKGNKFHFNQNLAQSKFATGMNGDEDLGEDITMKGNKFHFNQNLAQFATGMNGDEDIGEDITMKGNKFHFNQQRALMQMQAPEGPAPAAPFEADWEGYTFPDKVHTLDPKAAKRNTGFYAQMQ